MRPAGLISLVLALLTLMLSINLAYSAVPIDRGGLAMIGKAILVGLSIPPIGMGVAIFGLYKNRDSWGSRFGLLLNALIFFPILFWISRR